MKKHPSQALLATLFTLLAVGFVSPISSAREAAAPEDAEPAKPSVEQLVLRLTLSDPHQREEAAKALVNLGAEARPAVMRAMRSGDPELRAGAARVLLQLPWYLPDDSPGVRRVLEQYGKGDIPRRIGAIHDLSRLTNHGFAALERLIVEEPSDVVKWVIVTKVRECYREPVLERFRQLAPDTTEGHSAPLLAAAGHAWFVKDLRRGAALLRAAVDADLNRPAEEGGELLFAYERVEHVLLLDARHEELADLLRLRAARVPAQDADREHRDELASPPTGVLDLFALHARFGPLKGFDRDVERWSAWLADPRVMYSVARAYQRSGRGGMSADAIARAARLSTVTLPYARLVVGEFVLAQGWHAPAEGELGTVLSLQSDFNALLHARLRLSMVSQARDDDLEAADHQEQMLKLVDAARRGAADRELWHEIHWRHMKAAQSRGDRDEARRRLDELMNDAATIANPDVVNDLVPALRDAGRDAEAKSLFDRTYAALKQKADADPHPKEKNNLAWLCARCGGPDKRAEALALATAAHAALPDNAAFMDTLAEAHYQNGNYAKAVELERNVVLLRPGDRFLEAQLKRFEEALAQGKPAK